MKTAGWLALIFGLCAPAAFLLTLVTSGFWSWFEQATGIESFGHSGPAGWCFGFIYGLCVAAGVLALARWRRRSDAGRIPGP